MPAKRTAQSIRKQARERAVEAAANRERLARQRFEELRTKQRAQAKANEDDLAAYFGAEASIADAEERLAAIKQNSAVTMGKVAQAIAEREGSVSAAARLLGVAPARVSAVIRACVHCASRSAETESSPAPETFTSEGDGDEGSDNSGAAPSSDGELSDHPVPG